MKKAYGVKLCLLIVSLLAAGCTSVPTKGETMQASSASAKSLAKMWDEGNDLVAEGEKLKTKGEKMIEEGKDKVEEGDDLITEGKRMMAESERTFSRQFPGAILPK